MSTGWIRGRFVGTYAGQLAAVRGDGARRFSLELQSGSVHDAQWVEAPPEDDAPEGAAAHDDATLYKRQRLAHVRFAPPGESERVGALYDVRVEVGRLRHAHEAGNRSFGRLEGTIVARTAPRERLLEALAQESGEAPAEQPSVTQDAAAQAQSPASAGTAAPAVAAEPAPLELPRVGPMRPFVEPIRRASAVPLEPVPRGFHPAWLIVALVLAWLGLSAWLMCGPVAATTWAAPIVLGTLLRRGTLRLRLRFAEAVGWSSLVLLACQVALYLGPAEHAWRADCLPPLGVRLPVIGVLVFATLLLARLTPIALAVVGWSLLTFGFCAHVDGTCGARAAQARAEQRWPKDPEQVAAAVAKSVKSEPPKGATQATPVAPTRESSPAGAAAPLTQAASPTALPTTAPAPGAPAPGPAAPEAETPREPPHPASPLSMEQANRQPTRFFASKDKRSVVLPSNAVFGEAAEKGGAEVTGEGTIELSRLAALLKLQGRRRVRLELHAEPRGDADAEQALTERQAHAVRMWLDHTGGGDMSRLEVIGLGSRRPHTTPPADSDVPGTDARLELHVVEPAVRRTPGPPVVPK